MTEFLAGCSSGIVQSLIGHPIDTIKVLQQNHQSFYKNPLHYYRGISYPTGFNLMATGITFDLNARIKKHTGSHYSSGFILLQGVLLLPLYLCSMWERFIIRRIPLNFSLGGVF
jgi:hypothetical protein